MAPVASPRLPDNYDDVLAYEALAGQPNQETPPGTPGGKQIQANPEISRAVRAGLAVFKVALLSSAFVAGGAVGGLLGHHVVPVMGGAVGAAMGASASFAVAMTIFEKIQAKVTKQPILPLGLKNEIAFFFIQFAVFSGAFLAGTLLGTALGAAIPLQHLSALWGLPLCF